MRIRITEAGRRLGMHPETLKELERRGEIHIRRDWANHRVFSEDELRELEMKLFNKKIRVKSER